MTIYAKILHFQKISIYKGEKLCYNIIINIKAIFFIILRIIIRIH